MNRPASPRFRGALVRQLRELRGWSQRDLATRLGITRARITQLEGGAVPSVGLAARLGGVLALDWRQLFEDGTDDNGRHTPGRRVITAGRGPAAHSPNMRP